MGLVEGVIKAPIDYPKRRLDSAVTVVASDIIIIIVHPCVMGHNQQISRETARAHTLARTESRAHPHSPGVRVPRFPLDYIKPKYNMLLVMNMHVHYYDFNHS